MPLFFEFGSSKDGFFVVEDLASVFSRRRRSLAGEKMDLCDPVLVSLMTLGNVCVVETEFRRVFRE